MKSRSLFALIAVTGVAAATVAVALPVAASTTARDPVRSARPLALSDMQAFAGASALPRSAVVGMPACSTCH